MWALGVPESRALAISVLAVCNLWIAWRYSRLPLGQDEGLWLLWGFTGAVPYRDYIDCKPPGIHLWCWLLSRLAGRRLGAARFLHHAIIGIFAIIAYLLSGSFYAGLMFIALGQSAWLFAYQAWLEVLSTGLLLMGLLLPPWPATLCLFLAIVCNLKFAPAALLWLILHGYWIQLAAAVLIGMLTLGTWHLLWPQGLRNVWYGTITVASRISRWRKGRGQPILPVWNAYFAMPLLLVGPACAAGVAAHPDLVLWLPALAYIVTNALGRVWRPYHWIPLAAFAAAAAPPAAAFFLIGEWLASGFYLGDILTRTRPAAAPAMRAAKVVGERLRGMPGTLWVSDEFTQIYVYARRRPAIPFVEQVEIREVVPECRDRTAGQAAAADLIVYGPGSLWFAPEDYMRKFSHGPFFVLAHRNSE